MKSLPELNSLIDFSAKERQKIKTIFRRAKYLKTLQQDESIKNRSLVRKELGALIWLLDDAGAFSSQPVELYDLPNNGRH